ncbi:FG-GAP-like repeat-containing protein [Gracilimonas tropica]|uniref:FG-GAP-like repeat-containing protein n=1 Tax=Gracilimonas tropica TaxID=454600 RepID=UPI00037155F6|nr:FG-GAP-like repeat-containing protein [Gracilimonas tropica]
MSLRILFIFWSLIAFTAIEVQAQNLKITKIQPVNGTPGSSITIYGTGFDSTPGNNTVTFSPVAGGTSVTGTVLSESSNKLTVNIPTTDGGNYSIDVERSSDSSSDTALQLISITTQGGSFGATNSSDEIVTTTADSPRKILPVDINGDGDIDLLSANNNDNKVSLFSNDGSQNFSESTVGYEDGGLPSDVDAGDINADGHIDVVSILLGSEKVVWYENNGTTNPAFTSHDIGTGIQNVRAVATGDLNNDGDLDVVVVSNGRVHWFDNDGSTTPTFTQTTINSHSGTRNVFLADIDNDSDLDILTASSSTNTLFWYENDGSVNPSFTENSMSTTGSLMFVGSADLDNDGDIDIYASDLFNNNIYWYENDGLANPSFTERLLNSGIYRVGDVNAGDFNADGEIDLIAGANSNAGEIFWLENDGSATPSFSSKLISNSSDLVSSVQVSDIDGDGDLDIVSASQNDDRIAWYENTIPVSFSGRSLVFDGAGDQVRIPDDNALDLINGFTIEGWIHPRALVGNMHRMISKAGAYGMGVSTTTLRFTTYGVQDYNLPHSIKDSLWTHIAATIDASNTVTFYVNGENVGEISTTLGSAQASANDLYIGNTESDIESFNGWIDEVRIWNNVRTEEEIQTYLYEHLTGTESGIVAYYSFDEENGNGASDLSANTLNGTLQGDAAFSTETRPYGAIISGTEGWRMMTSPVTGANYGEILDTLWTQGFAGADYADGTANVLEWDETTQSFAAISDASDTPEVGQGFLVYVFDDDNFDGTTDGFPKTILSNRSQNAGEILPTLTFTDSGTLANDGWNLLGNPYGATIDWDASGWTTANLDASFYLWNADDGEYQSWNGTTGTLTSEGLIAPWQGFWVKANATNPSISFSDEIRSAGGIFRKENPTPELRFTLSDGQLASDAVVMFSEESAVGKDRLDAYKLASLNEEYLSLFTELQDGSALDINALPEELEAQVSIPLNMDGSDVSGAIELSWTAEALPEDWEFMLRDNETGQEVDLKEQSAVSFQLSAGKSATTQSVVASEGGKTEQILNPVHKVLSPKVMKAKSGSTSRFTLTISSAQAVTNERLSELPTRVELQQNYPNPFNPTTTIEYGVPEAVEVTLEVFDMLGRKVATLINREAKSAGRHSVQLDANRLSSGMYIYRLKAGNTVITKKLTLIK